MLLRVVVAHPERLMNKHAASTAETAEAPTFKPRTTLLTLRIMVIDMAHSSQAYRSGLPGSFPPNKNRPAGRAVAMRLPHRLPSERTYVARWSLPIGVTYVAVRMSRMIRKLSNGQYRLYSRKLDPRTRKRRNLGTFATRAAAEKHERAVQYFKRH
jgi:hypothetical protein